MSKFLAPIHFWLFNKIKLSEELQKEIYNSLYNKYDDKVKLIFSESIDLFGDFTEDKPLDEIIDTSNIHGWLQDKISKSETRTAYIITKATQEFGSDALNLIKDCYILQGKHCGIESRNSNVNKNTLELFKSLNNYILDGMPCDNAHSLTTKTDDLTEWSTNPLLHEPYWTKVGGDISLFYELRTLWIVNFISEANSSFDYANKDNVFHKIMKK